MPRIPQPPEKMVKLVYLPMLAQQMRIIGDRMMEQEYPCPDVQQVDGGYKVTAIVEGALMKMARDIRVGRSPGVALLQHYEAQYGLYPKSPADGREQAVYLSEAARDAIAAIAAHIERLPNAPDMQFRGKSTSVNRKKVIAFALLWCAE